MNYLEEREESFRQESLSHSEYMAEALFEYARNHGENQPEREWISTPYDTWERNPYYTGKPGRHPEAMDDDQYSCYQEDDNAPVEKFGSLNDLLDDGNPF